MAASLLLVFAACESGDGSEIGVSNYPRALISEPIFSQSIVEDEGISFAGTCLEGADNIPFSHLWNFGGGAPDSVVEDPGLVTFSVTGDFTVTYTCGDVEDNWDPTPAIIYVHVKPLARYVDINNLSGTEDGRSWATAFTSVQAAIDDTPARGEIWIAAGNYRAGVQRGRVADIGKSLYIYGGFTGTESSLAERPAVLSPTVFDGDFDGSGTPSPMDSRNVVYVINETKDVVLDGVIIQGGRDGEGAGMVIASGAQITIRNSSFLDNTTAVHGGGLAATSADIEFENVIFAGNSAYSGGGIVTFGNTNVQLYDVVFFGNSVAVQGGGAAFESTGSVTVANSLFLLNAAGYWGGGIAHEAGGSLRLLNVTIASNEAGSDPFGSGDGAGIWADENEIFGIYNSILVNNRNVHDAVPVVSDLFVVNDIVNAASGISYTCSEQDLASDFSAISWVQAQPSDLVPADLRGFGVADRSAGDGFDELYLEPSSNCVNAGYNAYADEAYAATEWSKMTTRTDNLSENSVDSPDPPAADAGMHYLR